MAFIVIDIGYGLSAAAICTDEDGDNLVFDTEEEANEFANTECQEGIVVNDCVFGESLKLRQAKRLIGCEVTVAKNTECYQFDGLVIDAIESEKDGVLISVLNPRTDENFDIPSKYIYSKEKK